MALVLAIAALRLLLHLATNHNYGFHRDELAFLDDARFLDWGYVAYPPFTPAVGRLGLELFGLSPNGIRLFAALAQAAAIVLTGDMARRLGGNRFAQALAALCVAVSPISVGAGSLFQYVTFDYLWWVLLAWCVVRLQLSSDPRWWLGAGAAVGLGMLTKFTIAFFVAALAVALLATPARRLLRSRWLPAGAALALLLFLPHLLWQIRHDFITLDFLDSIHARDVRIGRTAGFLPNQLVVPANLFSLPVWLAGLWYCWRTRPWRLIALWYGATLLLYAVTRGRDYYMGPAYPMLFATGALAASAWRPGFRRPQVAALALSGCFLAAVITPMAPVGSAWFRFASSLHGDLREEIGWPELTAAVARVYHTLPEAAPDRGGAGRAGILAGNYGEAGAINLYGPPLRLPRALSGINSHWLRGFPAPPPDVVVAIGFSRRFLEDTFSSVELAGRVGIPHGVANEESTKPDIYICRGLRRPWPEFWRAFRYFG
jgi:hypothetical protein